MYLCGLADMFRWNKYKCGEFMMWNNIRAHVNVKNILWIVILTNNKLK